MVYVDFKNLHIMKIFIYFILSSFSSQYIRVKMVLLGRRPYSDMLVNVHILKLIPRYFVLLSI